MGAAADDPGDFVPPGGRAVVKEPAGDEERGSRSVGPEDGKGGFVVVDVAIVERDDDRLGRQRGSVIEVVVERSVRLIGGWVITVRARSRAEFSPLELLG